MNQDAARIPGLARSPERRVGTLLRGAGHTLRAMLGLGDDPVGGGGAVRIARLTAAATIAYVAARATMPEPRPVVAPLTALLTVQATVAGTLGDTWRRVVAVVLGVMLAVAYSDRFEFNLWSYPLLLALSVLLGYVLRLGAHILEVPISAMVILGSNSAQAVVKDRILETLVGAGVGVAFSLLLPPTASPSPVFRAVDDLARELAALLDESAGALVRGTITVEEVGRWRDRARQLAVEGGRIPMLVDVASERRRLNPRALLLSDPEPVLRRTLHTIDSLALSIRALYATIEQRLRFAEAQGTGSEMRIATVGALTLMRLAESVRTFGRVAATSEEELRGHLAGDLRGELRRVREVRDRVAVRFASDAQRRPDVWTINGGLLQAADRALQELEAFAEPEATAAAP